MLSLLCAVDLGLRQMGLSPGGGLSSETAKGVTGLLQMVAITMQCVYVLALARALGARHIARAYKVATGFFSIAIVIKGVQLLTQFGTTGPSPATRDRPGNPASETKVIVAWGVIVAMLLLIFLVQ